jgi:ATP adenylyltransferase
MEQVFAPWRIEWVERDDRGGDDCVFCAFAKGDEDRENRVVARSEHAFVLLNNYPYNPGHVMVIPDRHTGKYTELSESELLNHAQLKQRTLRAVEAAFSPDGINLGYNFGQGAGGSITDHLHAHVVPRWEGDTNFMPVISETKVVVEAIGESYDRLYESFGDLDGAHEIGSKGAVQFR